MKHQRGYTLIEVIVAFALLALALGLLIGTLSGGARQVRAAERATRATLHAQSLLAGLEMEGPLRARHREGRWDEGRYAWQLDIQPWTDPQPPATAQPVSPVDPKLMQLDLSVRWGEAPNEQLHWRSLRLVPPALDGGAP